ncbi:MAG: hypothetical protein IPH99_08505 [Xanthomonadales bacterium]|nr:hypothetical protein [Xanthomonadales bacterium]
MAGDAQRLSGIGLIAGNEDKIQTGAIGCGCIDGCLDACMCTGGIATDEERMRWRGNGHRAGHEEARQLLCRLGHGPDSV